MTLPPNGFRGGSFRVALEKGTTTKDEEEHEHEHGEERSLTVRMHPFPRADLRPEPDQFDSHGDNLIG
jgi:hypothetical protein